jgi:hypothetical protein
MLDDTEESLQARALLEVVTEALRKVIGWSKRDIPSLRCSFMLEMKVGDDDAVATFSSDADPKQSLVLLDELSALCAEEVERREEEHAASTEPTGNVLIFPGSGGELEN